MASFIFFCNMLFFQLYIIDMKGDTNMTNTTTQSKEDRKKEVIIKAEEQFAKIKPWNLVYDTDSSVVLYRWFMKGRYR